MTAQFESTLASQFNVISHAQALAAGISKHQIAHRVKSGAWQRLFRGIYCVSKAPVTFEQWCQAALLRAGSAGLLWGATAARAHGLDGFTPPPSRAATDAGLPIVIATPNHVYSDDAVTFVEVEGIDEAEAAMVGPLRCASLVRSLIDAAETCTFRRLVLAFEDIHRRGHHRWLADRVKALRSRRPWLDVLTRLMARRGPDAIATESAAEALCDDILWRAELRADRQWVVRTRRSHRRIDLAFPKFRLGIECDSRAHHTAEQAFDVDRQRWAELSAQGWSLLHFTWKQLQDEAAIRQTVRRALGARGWSA